MLAIGFMAVSGTAIYAEAENSSNIPDTGNWTYRLMYTGKPEYTDSKQLESCLAAFPISYDYRSLPSAANRMSYEEICSDGARKYSSIPDKMGHNIIRNSISAFQIKPTIAAVASERCSLVLLATGFAGLIGLARRQRI